MLCYTKSFVNHGDEHSSVVCPDRPAPPHRGRENFRIPHHCLPFDMTSVLICPASSTSAPDDGPVRGVINLTRLEDFCSLKNVKMAAPTAVASAGINQCRTNFRLVDPEWLWAELRRSTGPGVLVVDCRNLDEYTRARIRGSVHLSLPSLLLRRLAAGKMPVENAIPCGVARDTFLSACDAGRMLVVCGKPASVTRAGEDEEGGAGDGFVDDEERLGAVASVLLKRLSQDGHEAVVLAGMCPSLLLCVFFFKLPFLSFLFGSRSFQSF